MAVHPDGYGGFRCANADVRQLGNWLAGVGATEQADVQR
jgi:hypothetical protein